MKACNQMSRTWIFFLVENTYSLSFYFPVSYQTIHVQQKKDVIIQRNLHYNPACVINRATSKQNPIALRNDKTSAPSSLSKHVTN